VHEPITPEYLNEIEERTNAATKGPWEVTQWAETNNVTIDSTGIDPDEPLWLASLGPCVHGVHDATFIAHSRTDLPRLTAEVRRLRAALFEIAAAACGRGLRMPPDGDPVTDTQVLDGVFEAFDTHFDDGGAQGFLVDYVTASEQEANRG
jgi:hypothetical protein